MFIALALIFLAVQIALTSFILVIVTNWRDEWRKSVKQRAEN